MNLAGLLHSAARAFPRAPALSVGTTPIHDYRGLAVRVSRLAAGLREGLECREGSRIGLVLPNCGEYVEIMWAAWHAGLCVVPVSYRLHPKEIDFIMGHCGASVVFTTQSIASQLELQASVRVVPVAGHEYGALAGHPGTGLEEVRADQPAWLFYTSGTTGRPKGAVLSHGNLLAMSLRYFADIDMLSERDCIIHAAPLSHASGLFSISHVAKASHQVIPTTNGFDPSDLLELAASYGSASFFLVPTMLARLTREAEGSKAPLAGIRSILYGGAPSHLPTLMHALAVFGDRLWQGYGQGESPNTIAHLPKSMHWEDGRPASAQRLGSVGIPRTAVDVRVIDPEGSDCAIGDVGEIICRSDLTMQGYWGDEAATRQSLRDGWLHTGDLGCFDASGCLTLKDRSKDVIISGGVNIYPREVEEALLQHQGVLEASVVGGPSEQWGEEIIAFVVCKPDYQLDDQSLDRVCQDHIARFKRPKRYVYLPELPKSPYGKVLKRELRNII